MAHIFFASYEVSPATPGGVGTFIAGIIKLLLEDGHRISLLLDIPEEQFEKWRRQYSTELPNHDRLHSFSLTSLCAGLKRDRTDFPSDAHWKSYQFAHALQAIHARTPVDFAEFFDYCGVAYYSLIARAADPLAYPKRIAIRLHNTIEIIDRRVSGDFASFRTHDYMLERAAIGLADLVLTPGLRYWNDEAKGLYPIADSRVQPSFPVRAVLPCRSDLDKGRDVVFVGRVSTFKGIDRVLHLAVAALADDELSRMVRRFVLVGPDETVSSSLDEQDLLSITEGVPQDRLVFRGRLSEREMLACYAEAAVAVFPNRMESFCYAAHEAYMAGVPLILSDTAAFRDHFEDGRTAVFFNNTIPDLVDKLRSCLRDPALRRRLSDSVRSNLARYGQHDYAAHLAGPSFEPQRRGQESGLTIIVVPIHGDSSLTLPTALRLAAALPGATVRCLVAAQTGPRVKAFGRFWAMRGTDGRGILPQSEKLRSAVVFVAAGDSVDPGFLGRAAAMLRAESRIGAVIPGRLTPEGHRLVSDVPTTMDRLAQEGFTLCSAVLAVDPTASLVDLCADGSAMTELAALLRLREQGRIIVDDPAPSLTRSRALPAPDRSRAATFLRQNAWRLDRTAVASYAAEVLALAASVSMRTAQPEDPQEIRHHVESSLRHPGHMFLHMLHGRRAAPDRKGTVMRLRRAPGQKLVSWSEVEWTGSWETAPSWDWSAGARVSHGGAMHVTGATDPEITLLLGPDQHRVVLIWRGQIFSIDLRDDIYRTITFRPSVFLSLQAEPGAMPPLMLDGRTIPTDEWVDLLSRSIAGSDGTALFLLDRSEIPLAEACRPAATVVPVPERLSRRSERMAAAFVAAARLAGATNMLMFGGEELLDVIRALLDADSGMTVDFYLRPGVAWRSGGWEAMHMIAQAAHRFPGRLCLHAPAGSVREALAALGITAEPLELILPQPRVRQPSGTVSLVLAPASTQVPAMGHLVAASAEALRRGAKITAIYMASHETQSLHLAEVYGIASLVRRYEAPDGLLASLSGTRFLYVSPFADGVVSGAMLSAFAYGGLAITSSGTLRFPDEQLSSILSVTLWEDGEIVADHIVEATSRYDELQHRYATMTETSLMPS